MQRFVLSCPTGDFHSSTVVQLVAGSRDWPGLAEASLEWATHVSEVHGIPEDAPLDCVLNEVTQSDGDRWITEVVAS